MKTLTSACLFSVSLGMAQSVPLPIQDTRSIRLWQGAAPGAPGTAETDIPSLTVYLPRNTPVGMTTVVIMPGGGYRNLAMNHEGRQVANVKTPGAA
jgi:hypothetical protein